MTGRPEPESRRIEAAGSDRYHAAVGPALSTEGTESRITVGETSRPADIRHLRGAVSARLTQRPELDGGQPMIAITAALMATSCSARLTVPETIRLRDALTLMIADAGASAVRTSSS